MFEGNITLHFQYKIICNSPNYYTKNWDQLNFDFKTIKMIQIQSRSKGRKKKKKERYIIHIFKSVFRFKFPWKIFVWKNDLIF